MTRKDLEEYRNTLKEIADLEKRIQREQNKEIETIVGTIQSSMKNFPFLPTREGVWIENPEQVETRVKLLETYNTNLLNAQKKKLEIETFISNIKSPSIRRIFRYRYIDGMSAARTGKEVGYTHGRVSQIISEELKD